MSMNAIHCFGVLAHEKDKAISKIKELCGNRILIERDNPCGWYEVITDDGELYRWIRPSESARGYRLHKLWVENSFKEEREFLDYVIYPKLYMQISEIVWFD